MQPAIPSVVSPALLACAHDVGLNTSHPKALIEWKKHALSCGTLEAVGFFLKGDRFMPVENKSEEPWHHFVYDSDDYLEVADDIEGIVHSHTEGPNRNEAGNYVLPTPEPTKLDMENQIATAVPWGISCVVSGSVGNPVWWGDQLPIRPLIGRVFHHGINDCFSLIRDQFRLWGFHFEDVPRDPWWWSELKEDGTYINLYEDLFESRGFVRVERSRWKRGDVFLAKLHSPEVRNHGGVFISNEEFIHHAGDHLSRRALGEIWQNKLDFLVRHKDMPENF
ncbi:tail assembly protein K [Rhizobium phage RHph_I4]|nr:tail assembly protein K [Rhizobium phage RHph_I4]